MRAAESKNTFPFTTMRPSSGVSMPATQRMVRLFPHPDSPRNPSVSSPAENATSSVNPLKAFLMSTSKLIPAP